MAQIACRSRIRTHSWSSRHGVRPRAWLLIHRVYEMSAYLLRKVGHAGDSYPMKPTLSLNSISFPLGQPARKHHARVQADSERRRRCVMSVEYWCWGRLWNIKEDWGVFRLRTIWLNTCGLYTMVDVVGDNHALTKSQTTPLCANDKNIRTQIPHNTSDQR